MCVERKGKRRREKKEPPQHETVPCLAPCNRPHLAVCVALAMQRSPSVLLCLAGVRVESGGGGA